MIELLRGISDYLIVATTVDPSGFPGYKPGSNSATNTDSNEIASVIQVVFGIIGALALLFITLSGLRYITAAGDPKRMQEAKEGIIYSLVGIAIALSAEVLVAFILGNL